MAPSPRLHGVNPTTVTAPGNADAGFLANIRHNGSFIRPLLDKFGFGLVPISVDIRRRVEVNLLALRR